ncbi:molybdopterin-dependent oxidoreductase [Nocardioides marmoriginsengisoli]|uniref:molybdopterin-dependent oxidoreductase n=1 Tax=Nocardioides marmoriginsengisoli TaxID=661483 RepID=UPI001FEA2710|nr:molybdopterin-dependent oxidoreductase [Nocardioides marmoriginsengisoli]
MKSTRRSLALAGILTGIAGLVTSQATVWIVQARNGPVEAVAALVRDYTPDDLAHWLIERVGHADKPLLLSGTAAILLALCAWAGVEARTRPLLPDLLYFVLAALGLGAVLRLDDSTVGSSFAVMVGLVTWIVVHRVLTAPLVADGEPSLSDEARRTFLRRVGGTAAAVAAAGVVGGFSSRSRRRVEQARDLLRLPVHRGAVPAGAGVGVSGVASWRTSNDRFYLIDTAFSKPTITPSEWRLRIHGMVERELNLTYNDLVDRMLPPDRGGRGKLLEDWITLCCVSNEVGGDLIGNAFWSGVKISDVLAEAGVKPGANAVLQTSDDGWTCGTPLEALTGDRNAMLALAMNGKPLPIEHGFPVRMVVPGLYGFVSATKWLVDLEVTTFDEVDAYWTQRGWAEKGPVLAQSRIDVPREGAKTATGRVSIGGSAWAQHLGIREVEYQLDGGAWQRARLGAAPDTDTWVQWAGDIDVDEGRHTLVVRATDKSGYTQTSVRTDVIPSGATGWHTIEFESR